MKKKSIALLMAVVMLFGAVGVTLAWLKDSTTEVVNTFTYGKIDIDLKEHDYNPSTDELTSTEVTTENEYKMIPGDTLPKDPFVTVKKGSEACWLFVEITESANFDTFMTWDIAAGWTLLEKTPNDETADKYVYYRKVDSLVNAAEDSKFDVLLNNTVTVKSSVVEADFTGLDVDNSGVVESDELPTLTFKAYAVQSENLKLDGSTTVITEAADAWTLAK